MSSKPLALVIAVLVIALAAGAFWVFQALPSRPPMAPPSVPERELSQPLAEPLTDPDPLPVAELPAPRDPLSMPFVAQAPLAEWADPRFQDACEEASLLMVAEWVAGGTALTPAAARQELLDLVSYQEARFGHAVDTDVADTETLLREYYRVEGSDVVELASAAELGALVTEGRVVIVPADGRKLGNPFFTPPGPVNHMLVVLAYDAATEEFVTHDPGTKRGALYRYPAERLFGAIRDYRTSATHLPNARNDKRVIAVSHTARIQAE